VTVELLTAGGLAPSALAPSDLADLGDLLLDAVADGASIGFLADLSHQQACEWWQGTLRGPDAVTWVARDQGRIVGTVRLLLVTAPNGRHRAEVSKFLVRRDARGDGHGRALMDALEAAAVADGRWLLLLDTQTSSHAEAVYERWGWQRIGVVPDHAATPDGVLEPTTFFRKTLARP
jgi:GNAT superfamily N-acetyltransferase